MLSALIVGIFCHHAILGVLGILKSGEEGGINVIHVHVHIHAHVMLIHVHSWVHVHVGCHVCTVHGDTTVCVHGDSERHGVVLLG